jgi:hypothetical protein
MRPRLISVAAAAALAVTAVACTPDLDTEGLEPMLKEQVQRETGTTVTSIDCPDNVKVEAGGTFECTATETSGATFTIKVVQTDDAGHVTWEIASASPGA